MLLILFAVVATCDDLLDFPVSSVAHLTRAVLDDAGVADALHFGSTRQLNAPLMPTFIDDTRSRRCVCVEVSVGSRLSRIATNQLVDVLRKHKQIHLLACLSCVADRKSTKNCYSTSLNAVPVVCWCSYPRRRGQRTNNRRTTSRRVK
jgi:hypothetical protein